VVFGDFLDAVFVVEILGNREHFEHNPANVRWLFRGILVFHPAEENIENQ
jgi:hypothetical protein